MKTISLLLPALALATTFAVSAHNESSNQEEQTVILQEPPSEAERRVCVYEHEVFSDLQVYIGDDPYLDPVCANT